HFASWLWLKKQKYDVYLSIQLQTDWVLRHETNPNKKLILWIQDPRPKSAWDNIINSMQTIKDPTFFTPSIYQTVHNWAKNGRITFISQGYSLNPLAIELYNLPQETKIQYLPNPIALDMDFQFDITKKKKKIIFLGRLEAPKRCWMFCEIAKRMPEYEFYVLGNFFQYQEDNKRMLTPYMTGDIPNLHFLGHVDGEKKNEIIKEARLLLSTAIWEGIPISWLEVLSYGTILVSDLEREKLVERFGAFVGEILGDGYDQVDKFIPAIKMLMENDTMYTEKALSAIQYIRETHNINRFRNDLVNVIYENV
ncbi:MAG: glycosyltransferase, partial [bacterium]|nr:glycosyltransferase [bacterium]